MLILQIAFFLGEESIKFDIKIKNMKYLRLIIILFCFQTFAQNTINDSIISTKKFEIKAAPIALLSSSNIFLGFEHYLNKDISYGVLTHINLNESSFSYLEIDNKSLVYQVSPFVRYSLSKKQTSFFYIESFLNFNGGEKRAVERLNDEFGNGYYKQNIKKYSDLGIGFGAGYKFYIKKTIGIDFNFGLSRNLFNENSIGVLPRGNTLISYRF
jgi:hypothetical protein